jgi:L-seryl-tRNA(Ser) seleniumtransferase
MRGRRQSTGLAVGLLSETGGIRHDADMSAGDARRSLPSLDRLLGTEAGVALLRAHRRDTVVSVLRDVLAEARAAGGGTVPAADGLMGEATRRLGEVTAPRLVPVINATGICLHTNLGRATLPDAALVALLTAAIGPTNLELDLETGRRGDRNALVADDLRALTGAEDALVVNNNAAGVLLALNSVAAGREVLVSRGELVEIGGSFRVPDVMEKSGARLREVGTTNRTHADDYRHAAGPATAAMLRVHASNYRIVGFTAAPTLSEMVGVARAADVPLIEDLGSGALVDLAPYGIPDEPVVRAHVEAGVDLVLASGDKLLGGPQAGIVVGRRALVSALRSNPLFRALRPSKLVLAALAATLRLYRSAPDLPAALPVLGWLARPVAEIERVGRAAAVVLSDRLGPDYAVEVVPSTCEVGGGAAPGVGLPSRALAVRHLRLGPERVAARLRRARPAVVGRVHEGRLLLDLRGIRDASELAVELDGD